MRGRLVVSVVAVAAVWPTASAAARWHMTDLGTLGGGASVAEAVNSRGEVAGQSRVDLEQHAFLWRDGRMLDLGALPGARDSDSVAIDAAGDVAGNSGDHGFFWHNGDLIDIGTLGGRSTKVEAMNAHGWITGQSDTRSGASHAFVWHDGRMTDLDGGTLGYSDGVAINDHGDVAVEAEVGVHNRFEAYRWHDGSLTRLAPPHPQDECTPDDIDEDGLVAGDCGGVAPTQHAVVWSGATPRLLDAPSGSTAVFVRRFDFVLVATEYMSTWSLYGIDRPRLISRTLDVAATNGTLVVGSGPGRAVAWANGHTWLLSPRPSRALAVSSNGYVAGWVRPKGSKYAHAALWQR